jgi:hypothetical protein
MRERSLVWIVCLLLAGVVCVSLLPAVPLAAQGRGAPASAAAAFRAPRIAALNQPNFQGIWQTFSSAHYDLEPHAASYGMPAGVGVVVDPASGKIPYTPAGLQKKQANFKNRLADDPHGKCWKPGTPHFVYLPFPFQIVQTGTQVTMISEYVHNVRTIYLNRAKHYPDGEVDFWNGDSFGKWEGDTLVTDVANFGNMGWLDRSGNHHSEALKVVERFTLIDADTMRYEATLTDPKTFTQPWTIRVLLYRRKEPNLRIMEYECHAYADNSLKEPVLPKVP